MNMNTLIIGGRIVRDPESRTSPSGTTICRFSIANNRKQKDRDITSFLDCTAFGKTAEVILQYMKKGSRILVRGVLEQQTWEKDGEKKSKFCCVVDSFSFVDYAENEEKEEPKQAAKKATKKKEEPEDNYEDIPF